MRAAGAPSLGVGAALVLSGCCIGGVSGSDCETVVDKILVCDPTAAGSTRATLMLQCAGTAPGCVAIDTTTPEGCAAFLGCLYDV